MADDAPLSEPAATQEALGDGRWGRRAQRLQPNTDTETAQSRQDARDDLKRTDDPDVPRFLRENPDADVYDFQRWVEHGRLRGMPRYQSRGGHR